MRANELEVERDARRFAVAVYRATDEMPSSERFGLTSQMRRAAISIGSNVSEGSHRRSDTDFARFVAMAEGSAAELRFQLDVALDLDLVDEMTAATLHSQLRSLMRRLSALHRTLIAEP